MTSSIDFRKRFADQAAATAVAGALQNQRSGLKGSAAGQSLPAG